MDEGAEAEDGEGGGHDVETGGRHPDRADAGVLAGGPGPSCGSGDEAEPDEALRRRRRVGC